MLRWRAGGGGLGWEVVAAVLTIAKLHGESVAYYESTVDAERVVSAGPDGYYSEDGSAPARAWVVARSGDKAARVVAALGVEVGARVEGAGVRGWFNKAVAPSGVKLGRAPGVRGVPGFDLTFCAPKSVSVIWGLSQDAAVRRAVDVAHARAVESALGYLAEHAGYTRRADGVDRSVMVVDRLEGLSGVCYEHRTSRAGDPHVHSHVLLANKRLFNPDEGVAEIRACEERASELARHTRELEETLTHTREQLADITGNIEKTPGRADGKVDTLWRTSVADALDEILDGLDL